MEALSFNELLLTAEQWRWWLAEILRHICFAPKTQNNTTIKKFEEKSREIMVRKKVDQYSCRQCSDNKIQDGTDLRKRVEAKRRF